jgi:hypothetical protein
MRIRLTLALALTTLAIPAAAQTKKTKHNHKSHSHGDAKLDIAVDGKTVSFDLESPGDVIFGFERRPKNDEEKAKIASEMARLNDKVSELFIFPSDVGCTLSEKEIKASQAAELSKEKVSEHADVLATYKFNCTGDLTGKKIATGLFKAWPRLKNLKVQILSATSQKGVTLKADATDIAL